jgi:hypothetical protein
MPLMRHGDQSVIEKMKAVQLVTLAAGIVFLAAEEAGFITSQVISVRSGLTMVG